METDMNDNYDAAAMYGLIHNAVDALEAVYNVPTDVLDIPDVYPLRSQLREWLYDYEMSLLDASTVIAEIGLTDDEARNS
jgi:hypothetical protein